MKTRDENEIAALRAELARLREQVARLLPYRCPNLGCNRRFANVAEAAAHYLNHTVPAEQPARERMS